MCLQCRECANVACLLVWVHPCLLSCLVLLPLQHFVAIMLTARAKERVLALMAYMYNPCATRIAL
jgi:hypothetical protein